MRAFGFLKGAYLNLFFVALILRVLLAIYAPDPNGYIYDFYSDAIVFLYEHGRLPASDACWVCYHPPLLPLIGASLFHIGDWFGADRATQLLIVASFLNGLSLIFSIYTFAIYRLYRKVTELDLVLWSLLLFLPVVFISSFSIEADLLVSVLIVIASYHFALFLNKPNYTDLSISAIIIGIACLAKYNGAVVASFFGLVLLGRFILSRNRQCFKFGLTYAILVVILGSYPYIKNIQIEGIPIVGNKAWKTDRNYYNSYYFKTFSLQRIMDVFEDNRPIKLKHYSAYNNEVLTSHYAQLWTDFSFFTIKHRHGQWNRDDIYPGKTIPTSLLWGLLVVGLVPVIAGFLGFFLLMFSGEATLLLGLFVISVAVYIDWFLGHGWWMLKTKYLMFLLPLWLISINKFGAYMPSKIIKLALLPSVIFSALYCFVFAVF